MTFSLIFYIIIVEFHEKVSKKMEVCFIGHRDIRKTEELISSLKETVKLLIEKGATTFLFGSKSEFDDLALQIVTEFKKEKAEIKRVYVRSAFQNIDKLYEEYLLKHYEETYFPQKIEKAGKYSYVERNYEMINRATYCIFYYNENNFDLQNNANKECFYLARKSGTQVAYNYAVKKKKKIINLCK